MRQNNKNKVTFARILAILNQNAIAQAETSKQIRELKESQAKTDEQIKITQQEIRELKVYVEGVASELRGLGISQGKIGEEVLFQALKKA